MLSEQYLPPNKIDHIGIAVQSIEKALFFYRDFLGLPLEKIETISSEGVMVAFLKIGEIYIELLEPLRKTSTIYKFLEKQGEGVHHIALATADIEGHLERLIKRDVKIIYPLPKRGANHKRISFIHPASAHGVLYELCSKK